MPNSDILASNLTESETNCKSSEDLDIYSDVLSDNDKINNKLKQKVAVLTNRLNSLQINYEQLQRDYRELQSKYKNVSYNSSALFKTAQAEITRKDRTIQELRKDYDNLVFRKSPAQYSGRQTRSDYSSKKKSPPKKINLVSTNPTLPLDNIVPSKVLEEVIDHQEEVIKNPTKQKETKSQHLSKNDDQLQCKNSKKNIPPPIQGPVTAYSKRMYKKLYGVSPEKTQILSSEKFVVCDKKTPVSELQVSAKPLSLEKSTNELDSKCESDVVSNNSKPKGITSKLQEEVKGIIKLGSNRINKTSPPSTKASPCEKPKHEVAINNTEGKVTNSSLKSATSSKLIIKCDLREKKDSLNSSQSPNSVSIHETINNILKKHKDVSNVQNITPNKSTELSTEAVNTRINTSSDIETPLSRPKQDSNSCKIKDNTNMNKSQTRLTSVEKLTQSSCNSHFSKEGVSKKSKPLILPATFGKLVPLRKNKDITNISPDQMQRNIPKNENRELPRKRKQSSLFSPRKDTPKVKKTRVSSLKKNTYLDLFGESPVKAEVLNNTLEKESLNKLRSPTVSPVQFITCSSPVLPSSPSLDSDNLEIDTTACSQNTTPRISESDQKDGVIINKTPPTIIKIGSIDLESLPESQSEKQKQVSVFTTELRDTKKVYSACDEVHKYKKEIKCEHTLGIETSKMNLNSPVSKELSQNGSEEIPSISINLNEKGTCLPDLSECFSLDNDYQQSKRMQSSGKETIPADSKTITEQSQSNNGLLKIIPNQTLIELKVENCDTNLKEFKFEKPVPKLNASGNIPTAPRFIPSPPQLTLVSAFKHSENSVFNITEDTVGFVSALTRVRDISPIKTPDKSNKPTNISKHPSSSHNMSESTTEIDKTLETSKSSCITFKNVAQNSETIVTESEIIKAPQTVQDKRKRELVSESKSASNVWNKETAATATKIKITGQNNEFKRARPIRRLVAQTTDTVEMLSQPNKENIKTLESSSCDILTKVNVNDINNKKGNCDDSVTRELSLKPVNCDRVIESVILQRPLQITVKESECPNVEKSVTSKTDSKLTLKEVEIHETDKKDIVKDNIQHISSLEINSSLNKLALSLKTSPLDKTVFKRSESLKMMPKPIPKINYDTLSKYQDVKEESKSFKISRPNKEITPTKELSQIPHINNINKKVRVSKYQIGCKERSPSPEPASSRKNILRSRSRDKRNKNVVHKHESKQHSNSLHQSQNHRNRSYYKVEPEKSPSSKSFSINKAVSVIRRSRSHTPGSKNCRKRSRSISPSSHKRSKSDYRRAYHRSRDRSRHFYRRSRSKSPFLPRKRIWRSRSSDNNHELFDKNCSDRKYKVEGETNKIYDKDKVSDGKRVRQKELCYNEELERLRKELLLIKRILNKNSIEEEKDSLNVSNIKLMPNPQPVTEKSNLQLNQASAESMSSDHVNIIKVIQAENKPNITGTDEVKSTSYQNCSQFKETTKSSGNCTNSPPKKVSQAAVPFKIIKLNRRRNRNLGDSDVNVVSSSTKINNRTQSACEH